MPPILKALASVTAWILFIFGFLALIGGIVVSIGPGNGVPAMPKSLLAWAHFGYGSVNLILSVAAMRLRQMLE